MELSEPIKAVMVQTIRSEKVSLQEGEEVQVLDLSRDPKSRWQCRVAGHEGSEAVLRPCLLGQGRRSQTLRLLELSDVELIVQELSFWRRLWEPVSPRKAEAMERIAYWVSSASPGRGSAVPRSVLHDAWTRYRRERRNR